MARKPKPDRASQRTRKGLLGWLLLAAIVLAALGFTAWSQFGPSGEANDPNVVVNLTSMVGRQAPAFTLSTSEGASYTVTPGNGRKVLLIFHMGSV